MPRLNPSLTPRRNLAFALVLLALFVSAALPRGIMIAPSASQTFEVTLCPGTHPLARAVLAKSAAQQHMMHAQMGHAHHHDHGAEDKTETSHQGSDCAFSGLGFVALPLGDSAWELAERHFEALSRVQYWAFGIQQPSHLRPPLRGPPRAG